MFVSSYLQERRFLARRLIPSLKKGASSFLRVPQLKIPVFKYFLSGQAVRDVCFASTPDESSEILPPSIVTVGHPALHLLPRLHPRVKESLATVFDFDVYASDSAVRHALARENAARSSSHWTDCARVCRRTSRSSPRTGGSEK